eukprot:TRINITY_DN184_c0_g1_i2.p1 TRINITY_DN184_c0_g1~~TRINITY_DN184_c0_g1_i2.p1  ORF type:complete len:282 (-),score=15.07 TRINITY_DN184_c0_g1_i2:562-1407(-)
MEGHNVTDVCVNNYRSMCDTLDISGFLIQSPELIPTCILAGWIGYHAATTIISLKNARGYLAYSLTFAMFGTMMTDAMFNDCFLARHGNQHDWVHFMFMLVDLGLTSSVGLSFAWNGLVDIGWINENSRKTQVGMLVSYLGLFGSWAYAIDTSRWGAFLYLYIGVVGLSGLIYCVTEITFKIRSRSWDGMGWVLVAFLTGAIGLAGVAVPSFDLLLCHTFGCHFGGNFLWFVLTDVAMWSCYKFYMATLSSRTVSPNPPTQSVEMAYYPVVYVAVPTEPIM